MFSDEKMGFAVDEERHHQGMKVGNGQEDHCGGKHPHRVRVDGEQYTELAYIFSWICVL